MNVTQVRIEPMSFASIHDSVVKIFEPQAYGNRMDRLLKLAHAEGFTHVAIYGDREHFANIHYFTGYDPRFEEALLILSEGRKPLLLAGNEGIHYATVIPYELDVRLFQSFSLAGQARDAQTIGVLGKALEQAGINADSRVGVIGWKYFTAEESDQPDSMFDIPHYLVEKLQAIVAPGHLKNATALMIDPVRGMRTTLDVDELAVLELAGTKSSRSVYNLLSHLEPGMTEIEASAFLGIDGDPQVAHPNVNFTIEGIRQGLVSPGCHRLQLGSVCNVGFGYRSSMVARTAMYVHGPEELPKEYRQFWDSILVPYFQVMAVWYGSLELGVTGKSIVERIKREVPGFNQLGIGLNPGHLIHNDEWTTSVFTETGAYALRSGMAIQCDIIATPADLPGVHVEDGLALADSDLRQAFRASYPEAWNRVERRRNFMKQVLGIQIRDEVMPFSDIPGCLFPWMADLGVVMAIR